MISFFEKYPVNFNFLQLNKKRNAVIGIDITSSAVKLVELSKKNTGYTLESCSVVPFPRNEQNLQQPNTYVIGQTIQKALYESKTKVKQAAIAGGGASVITKNISIPAGLNDDEIIEQIIIDAAKYIPYNINDVFWDFEIQGINKTNTTSSQKYYFFYVQTFPDLLYTGYNNGIIIITSGKS